MIEAVLFDIDDTLLDHTSAARAGFGDHLEDLGTGLSAAEVDAAWTRWQELEGLNYPRYLSGELTVGEGRRLRAAGLIEHLGGSPGTNSELDEWFGGFLGHYERHWRAFADVEPCLRELGDRARGVITNAELAPQLRKLERLGLRERLALHVASGESGHAKPDPRIFEHACERLGLPPERVAYVGDRPETDALGATAAGLLGIWLDRQGRGSGGATPVVGSLLELRGIVGGTGAGRSSASQGPSGRAG